MGRHNRPGSVVQRHRISGPANRELRMALKAPQPESFGIKRRLNPDGQTPLLELFAELQAEGTLPDTIDRRQSMHVTIFPKSLLDAQIRQGIIAGYELGRALPVARSEIGDFAEPDLVVKLGRAIVIKGRAVAFRIESEQLAHETRVAQESLARLGLKGAICKIPPIHASIGNSDAFLFRTEQRDIERALNDTMPVGEEIALQDVEFYPDHQQVA